MRNQVSQRLFSLLPALVGLILCGLLVSCGESVTPTPVSNLTAPPFALPLNARPIVLPKEISDYLSNSTPSGATLTSISTIGLSDEPAQVTAAVDKMLSAVGYSPTGKPAEKDGVFTRFYKTTDGKSEAVAAYGRSELSLQAYRATKISPAVLDQYAAAIRQNKTVLGITTGSGLLKLYGIS